MLNIERNQVIRFVKGAAITILIAMLYVLATAITGNAQGFRATTKPGSAVKKATPTKPVPTTTAAAEATPTPATSAATASAPVATTTSTPATASNFLNPYVLGMNTGSMAVKGLFEAVERINRPDSLKKPVGPVGVGLAVQTNGSALASMTVKTKWNGYVSVLAGRTKNTLYVNASGQFKQNPLILAGIGFVAKPHVYIGGLLGAQFYQELERADARSYAMKAGKFTPTLLYGLQLSVEMRHVWGHVNLISGNGIGVGATYFF